MAEAFVAALAADLISADDFACRPLAVALDDAVGDQRRAAGAVRARSRRASSRRFAVGDHLQGPRPDLVQRAGGGDPVAERLGARPASRPCRSTSRMPGSRGGGLDQRQGDRAVEQVGAARLAGPLRRAGDVEDVVEQLEGEADLGAEVAQAPRRRGRAGRRTRTASPSSAGSARGSAARRSRGRRRRGAGPARRGRARPRRRRAARPRGASPASASRAKARENSRSPVATARSRPELAATVGRPRRSGASSRTSSWTRVAMWTSSIAVAARTDAVAPVLRRRRAGPASAAAACRRRPGSRPASSPSSSPWPPTSPRSRSSTSPRRAGSQRLEASRTAVTGGGTAERSGHPRDAAVDRDDPAGEHRVADPLEAGRGPSSPPGRRGLGKLRTDSGR